MKCKPKLGALVLFGVVALAAVYFGFVTPTVAQAGVTAAASVVMCALLHGRHGTYEEVARRTGLDRRTVKKYLDSAAR